MNNSKRDIINWQFNFVLKYIENTSKTNSTYSICMCVSKYIYRYLLYREWFTLLILRNRPKRRDKWSEHNITTANLKRKFFSTLISQVKLDHFILYVGDGDVELKGSSCLYWHMYPKFYTNICRDVFLW